MRRAIVGFYLLLFLSLSIGSGIFFWQTKQEYNRLQQVEAQSKARLADAQERLHEQEQVLNRLRTDPAYVEMVIRRRLGYAKPNETVFRFEH